MPVPACVQSCSDRKSIVASVGSTVSSRRCAACLQRHEEQSDAPDMGEREREGVAVACLHVEPLPHGKRECADGGVGVSGAFRVGGGSRGVGQPSNIVIGRNYHRGQRCGVTGRERVGTDGQRAEIGIVV